MTQPRRLIEALITRICSIEGIQLSPLCAGWVLQLEREGLIRQIYGYQFDLNASAASLIAHDKSATATLLARAGVPALEHALFRHGQPDAAQPDAAQPDAAEPDAAEPDAAQPDVFAAMARYFERHGRDLVCKPNQASGGEHVSRVRSVDELEASARALFARGLPALCLSPYREIRDEYRVILLDRQPLLLYRKQRPSVTGDGRRTLAQLAEERFPDLRPDLRPDPATATQIPPAGESVLLGWQHNLALGARAELVSADHPQHPALIELASQATDALQLRLAAVDLVSHIPPDTSVDTDPPALAVLEVNPGIMLERFGRQGPPEAELAGEIYRRIVSAMMQP